MRLRAPGARQRRTRPHERDALLAAGALATVEPESLRSQGYAFQVELAHRTLRSGLAVEEIPIVFRGREHGRSKMSARIALEAAWLVPALRFARWMPNT